MVTLSPIRIGWLKKRMALAVKFESIDYCAKKPTPKTGSIDDHKINICLKSTTQIIASIEEARN
jgi:hypothetical protein